MSRPRKANSSDPRRAGGAIVGPGGPRDQHGVVISTERAVLLDYSTVAKVEPTVDGVPQPVAIALELQGRINQTDERAHILYLLDADGAAALCSELMTLADRMGIYDEFERLLLARLDRIPT